MTAVVDRPEAVEPQISEGASAKAVGYGKPPVSGRFQPGRSGDPKGRPRKNKDQQVSLDRILATEIEITGLDGKQRVVSKQEAFLERLMVNALKGEPNAV